MTNDTLNGNNAQGSNAGNGGSGIHKSVDRNPTPLQPPFRFR